MKGFTTAHIPFDGDHRLLGIAHEQIMAALIALGGYTVVSVCDFDAAGEWREHVYLQAPNGARVLLGTRS